MTKKVRSVHSLAIQRQPMRKPVATPRGGSHRDGAVAGLLRTSFRTRYGAVVIRSLRVHGAVTVALLVALATTQPALAAGNLTLPFANPNPRITPWHSIDPYGWTGPGPDPWRWDMGNLWAKGTPVPFLLPLAFPGGARWNYWYGSDGPPPPVSWHLRDGGHGLAGFAAQWDQDPGPGAARIQATSGSAAVPGPGSHTLHLRVFDRAGTSADITYLYLYDVEAPTSALTVDRAPGSALNLHWSGHDQLAGVENVAIEVGADALAFRPWFTQRADQASAGKTLGAVRYFGDPGTAYQFRLTVRDAARNAAPPVVLKQSVPAGAGAPSSAADRPILGPLPAQPDGAPSVLGVRQEHPSAAGALLLDADASL